MIQFATKNDISALKTIWKTVFDDSDFFIDLFFSYCFQPDNTLVFRRDEQIAGTLFMQPYEFRFWGEPIACYYLSGLATLPEFRCQGIMAQLLKFSCKVMWERRIAMAILIPTMSKIGYYRKFGYYQVFHKRNDAIPLAEIIDNNRTLSESYTEFNSIYRTKDFCIQKDFTDFQAIVADWEYDLRPPKTDVAGMAQLIAPNFLFNIFRKKTACSLKLNLIKDNTISLEENILSTNKTALCRLLFGENAKWFPSEIVAHFPAQQPVLNLMLE